MHTVLRFGGARMGAVRVELLSKKDPEHGTSETNTGELWIFQPGYQLLAFLLTLYIVSAGNGAQPSRNPFILPCALGCAF